MPRKRRNYGSGSVYRNKDGTYTAQSPRDEGGRITRSRHTTRQEAEAALARMLEQQVAGVDLRQAAKSVEAFVNLWYAEAAVPNIKPKTAAGYRHLFEHHILPSFGAMRLDALTPEGILHWLKVMKQHEVADTTRLRAFNLFRQMLDDAEDWKRIVRNPAAKLTPPRVQRSELVPLALAQVQLLLAVTAEHRLAALYYLACLLGLRQGELLGLLWSDYDRTRATLAVTQQVQTIGGKTAIERSTKTLSGRRRLPLPEDAVRLLDARGECLQREREHPNWREHGLIFPSEVGTPMSARNLSRHYYTARDKAELSTETYFHLLRHTCATMLADHGASELVIAAILGHRGGSVTRRYVHPPLTAMRFALEQLAGTLREKA